MRHLEVPFHFSGVRIERNDGTAEEVVAGTIAAVVIVRTGRIVSGKDDATLRIEAHRESPLRGAWTVLVTVAAPRFNSGIAGLLRDRSKLPHLRAGARIERARSTGIAIRSDNEEVLVHSG